MKIPENAKSTFYYFANVGFILSTGGVAGVCITWGGWPFFWSCILAIGVIHWLAAIDMVKSFVKIKASETVFENAKSAAMARWTKPTDGPQQ